MRYLLYGTMFEIDELVFYVSCVIEVLGWCIVILGYYWLAAYFE